jgi:ABC-type glycerol-3-phosphate transport system permease component
MGADIVSEAGLTVVRGRTQSAATGKASGLLPRLGFAIYLLALMLPIYWLVSMSLRSNEDITSRLAF